MTPPHAKTVWVYADVVCDLFHFGHVEFLRRARTLGDKLLVGVLGDDDAETYKPRPIMNFAERVAVLEACRYVDRVLPFPAPLHCTRAFLAEIGADFCCHGDDMAKNELVFWYGDLVGSGMLRVVSYSKGISSREIMQRVIARQREDSS